MGGKILAYEARTIKNEVYAKAWQEGYAKGWQEGSSYQIIRIRKCYNCDNESIINELVNELGISVSKAQEYLEAYSQ